MVESIPTSRSCILQNGHSKIPQAVAKLIQIFLTDSDDVLEEINLDTIYTNHSPSDKKTEYNLMNFERASSITKKNVTNS